MTQDSDLETIVGRDSLKAEPGASPCHLVSDQGGPGTLTLGPSCLHNLIVKWQGPPLGLSQQQINLASGFKCFPSLIISSPPSYLKLTEKALGLKSPGCPCQLMRDQDGPKV